MTQAARVVLQDAKYAIAKHSEYLQSEAFRVSWFSIVGLLRAVGHVLDKVDTKSSSAMKRAIEEKWMLLQKSRPEPHIFWGFIEIERNRFLKNYQHGINRALVVPVLPKNSVVMVDCGNLGGGTVGEGYKLRSIIVDGHYAGSYEREVATEAYKWWKSYLDEVDNLARTYEAI